MSDPQKKDLLALINAKVEYERMATEAMARRDAFIRSNVWLNKDRIMTLLVWLAIPAVAGMYYVLFNPEYLKIALWASPVLLILEIALLVYSGRKSREAEGQFYARDSEAEVLIKWKK